MKRCVFALLLAACGDDGAAPATPDAADEDGECPCTSLRACVDKQCVPRAGLSITLTHYTTPASAALFACFYRPKASPPMGFDPIATDGPCRANQYPAGDYALWERAPDPAYGTIVLDGLGTVTELAQSETGCFSYAAAEWDRSDRVVNVSRTAGGGFPQSVSVVVMPPPLEIQTSMLVPGEPLNLTWTPEAEEDQILWTMTTSDDTTVRSVSCRGLPDTGSFTVPGTLTSHLVTTTPQTVGSYRILRDHQENVDGTEFVVDAEAFAGAIVTTP